jgi:ABC-type branched-subunit amino acid transport system ATPase component/branched-subunit amino acid ABC-type transport system permease component
MHSIIQFALLGLGTGAIYGLLAQGLVVVYRGSGVINFAHGAVAMASGYMYYELHIRLNYATPVALALVLVTGAVFGVLVQLLVMRPMRNSSSLARMVATLALLTCLEAGASLIYGSTEIPVPTFLPNGYFELVKGAPLDYGDVAILIVALVATAILWFVYRYTQVGRVTQAVAEDPVAAATLGKSPNVVACVNWAVGCLLAAIGGCLISPSIGLEPTTLSLLIVPALAAAVVGGFRSFPISLVAGLVIGVVESEISSRVSVPGWQEAAPLVVIVIVIAARGRSLPVRGDLFSRLPKVESSRTSRLASVVMAALLLVVVNVTGQTLQGPILISVIYAILAISIVIVTGYTGQLALAPLALAGVGALIAVRLANAGHLPILMALLTSAVCSAVIGLIFALPALRTRGANLAIVTLSLGAVLNDVILTNYNYTGGETGIMLSPPEIFGWSINPLTDLGRYASVTVLIFLAVVVATQNLRKGTAGRQMLAVRDNERAAASVGINVRAIKLYAFALSGLVAGLAGLLLVYSAPVASFTNFDPFSSVTLVSLVVLSGVGYVAGAGNAGLIVVGGFFAYLLSLANIDQYVTLIGGVAVLLNVILAPDGVAVNMTRSAASVWHRVRKTGARGSAEPASPAASAARQDSQRREHQRVSPRVLEATGISVYFGRVQAVRNVSFRAEPGQVLGIIGPNGAGKTTLIDAVSGFVPATGQVSLGGKRIDRMRPHRRAAGGLARSFQSVELFNELSTLENISVAGESAARLSLVSGLVKPRHCELSAQAEIAVEQLGLALSLPRQPDELSFATRRLIGIGRCLAMSPSVLLLDEPAAGLSADEIEEMTSLVRSLADDWGIAVVIVEHHLEMIMSICDQVLVLAEGAEIATGTPQEIRKHAAVRAAYLGDSYDDHPQLDGRAAAAVPLMPTRAYEGSDDDR